MDSLCAAYAYAELKNTIDRVNHYKAVRCGHLSDSVMGQFAITGIQPPPYMPDINPKVGDVLRTDKIRLDYNSPVYDLMKIYHETKPSALPIFDGEKFCGLLSIDDITSWFLKDNVGEYPYYDLTLENIEKVIPCGVIKRGKPERFRAPILSGASHVAEHPDAVVVMPYGKKYAQLAMDFKVPAMIFTDVKGQITDLDFSSYEGSILISKLETTEAIRRLRMAAPLSTLLDQQGPILQITDLFDDAKEQLVSSRLRGLAVFDGENYAGFVTRRCFLRKPKFPLILVDHNEPDQSIRGIESAEVREIIDHHRLDAPKTELPIFIDAEPLGSTCTIVYQLFVRNSVVPDLITSKVLLAGILADTISLRSPTTSAVDVLAVEKLAPLSGVADYREFGKKMFENVETLMQRDPEKVITSDFKTYREGGMELGIGQCEVPTLSDINDYCDSYISALDKLKTTAGLDWVLLMITDVLKGKSVLLSSTCKFEAKLPYEKIKTHVFNMNDAVSRKKQLLPELIHVLNG